MSTTVTGSKRHLNINADEFAGDLNGTVNTATTATTQSTSDNSTKVATTAFVKAQGYITTQSDTQDLSQSGNTVSLVNGGSVDISTTTAVAANTAKVSNVTQTSVSGNAGSVTNGVYTTGNQTIGGIKHFTSEMKLGTYNSTVGGILNIFGTTANKQSIIKTTNGNLHIDASDGHSMYLNYYAGVNAGSNIIFGNGDGAVSGAYVRGDGRIVGTTLQSTGSVVATSLDINGNADISGTLITGTTEITKVTNTSGTTGVTFLELDNNVGGDISQQQTFIDFKFTDTNANHTPQVRIGAQVGPDADANAISKEGAGSFVVYTAPIGNDELGGSTGLAEAFRVSHDGKATVAGSADISQDLTVGAISRNAQTTLSILTDAEQSSILKFREDNDNFGFTFGF